MQKKKKMSRIKINNGVTRHPLYRFSEPINLCIDHKEQIAIIGDNAAGKSILVDTITTRYPLLLNEVEFEFSNPTSNAVYDNIKQITFRDSYGDSDFLYYQQRFNSQDAEITPIVNDLLPQDNDNIFKKELFEIFETKSFLHKNIVALSSGELRKFQLVRTLLCNPRVLIIDNPFIGLDKATRELLRVLLKKLIDKFQIQIILVLSKKEDIPSFITHVIEVENRICKAKTSLKSFLNKTEDTITKTLTEEKLNYIYEFNENLRPEIFFRIKMSTDSSSEQCIYIKGANNKIPIIQQEIEDLLEEQKVIKYTGEGWEASKIN